jgi:hypothetical protein
VADLLTRNAKGREQKSQDQKRSETDREDRTAEAVSVRGNGAIECPSRICGSFAAVFKAFAKIAL